MSVLGCTISPSNRIFGCVQALLYSLCVCVCWCVCFFAYFCLVSDERTHTKYITHYGPSINIKQFISCKFFFANSKHAYNRLVHDGSTATALMKHMLLIPKMRKNNFWRFVCFSFAIFVRGLGSDAYFVALMTSFFSLSAFLSSSVGVGLE